MNNKKKRTLLTSKMVINIHIIECEREEEVITLDKS